MEYQRLNSFLFLFVFVFTLKTVPCKLGYWLSYMPFLQTDVSATVNSNYSNVKTHGHSKDIYSRRYFTLSHVESWLLGGCYSQSGEAFLGCHHSVRTGGNSEWGNGDHSVYPFIHSVSHCYRTKVNCVLGTALGTGGTGRSVP